MPGDVAGEQPIWVAPYADVLTDPFSMLNKASTLFMRAIFSA